MRKGYLRKLLEYMKKVYKIEDILNRLSDNRVNPTYRTSEAILPVLLGFLVRIQSLNELKHKIRSKDFKGVLSRKTKLPQIDVVREVLKRIDLSGLENFTSSIIKKAKENKVFKEGTLDGYTVAAIDGTKLFGSNIKSCPECCKSTLKNGKVHNAHNAVFISLIGSHPRLTIDFELYQGSSDSSKKAERELTVAKRLLEKVCQTYNRMVDIVVYDALACNSVWINHCIKYKITPVVHVKENNISSIKEIKSKINKSKCKEEWQDFKISCLVKAYEESFKMDGVTDTLRFVKFSKKTAGGKYSQVLVVTTDFDIPLQTLYKIMHKRWDIENSTFNKLKTYAGLDHCFVHHTNAIEAILHLMITANNIMQLFVHRRLTSKTVKEMPEKELIRLIEKGMYTYKEKLVLDTC